MSPEVSAVYQRAAQGLADHVDFDTLDSPLAELTYVKAFCELNPDYETVGAPRVSMVEVDLRAAEMLRECIAKGEQLT